MISVELPGQTANADMVAALKLATRFQGLVKEGAYDQKDHDISEK